MTSSHKLTLISHIALVALLSACDKDSTGSPAQGAAAVQTFGDPVARVEPELRATASLSPAAGYAVRGEVQFLAADNQDGVHIRARIEGLQEGFHGFHVHENGDCSAPDASSAGGHFNPSNNPHGARTDDTRHVGDLGNVEAGADGIVSLDIQDRQLALTGEASILGKAVVVHADPDDLKSQPSGNAGSRVACGVIEPARPGAVGERG